MNKTKADISIKKIPCDNIIMLDASRILADFSSSAYSLSRSLALKGYNVIHINNPLSITQLFKSNGISSFFKFEKEFNKETNFKSYYFFPFLPINWLPKGFIYRFFLLLNNIIFNLNLKRVLKKNNISSFIFNNSFLPYYSIMPSIIKRNNLIGVYLSVDHMEACPYLDKHGPYLEREVVRNTDLLITTSLGLREKFDYIEKCELLQNACNFQVFQKGLQNTTSKPIELQNIKSPIVGYFGNIDDERIDFELLNYICSTLDHVQFVFIGPLNSKNIDKTNLKSFSNVHFLGPKKYEDIPAYLKYFDCCIIPFKLNELNAYIYPLKVNEYLIAAKNVVATRFSKDIETFEPLIYLANSNEDFKNSILDALKNDNEHLQNKRVETAQSNSWENRSVQYLEILSNYIRHK